MDSPLGKFIQYLLKKPLLVNLVLIFIVLLSIVSIFRMQKVGLPRVDTYEVTITTIYPGASPEDVELNVTRKIEEALEEVSDIEYSYSQSMENLSIVDLKIQSNTEDVKEVKDEIRRAIADISDFPAEVDERPKIFEHTSDNWAIYEVGLYHEKGDRLLLQKHAKELRKALMELPTVAKVNKVGVPDREFKIKLNKAALSRYDISFEEVINAIKYNKIRLSAGSLESFTSEKGIVTFSEFTKPSEIGNIIIKSNDMGYFVTLKNVAHISLGLEDLDIQVRIKGEDSFNSSAKSISKKQLIKKRSKATSKEGMWLAIVKQGNADIVDAVEQINACIKNYRQTKALPNELKFVTLRDESVETKLRMNILLSNAVIGLVLVLFILFLFFSRRIALWTTAGIPIAVGIAFIVVSFFDVTINRISLLGLVVVLGMLVDDSIIVAENIFRQEEKGEPPRKAAVIGTLMVVNPVIATVITTILAFVPMYFVPGMEMDFAREIPTFVIAMLIGSLIESIIILPSHLGHGKQVSQKTSAEKREPVVKRAVKKVVKKVQASKKRTKKQAEDDIYIPVKPPGEKFLLYLEKLYEKILHTIIKHKYKSLLGMTLFIFCGFFISNFITKFTMFPTEQAYHMIIYGETAEGSSLKYTSKEVKKIERILDELPFGKDGVIKSYKTVIGQKGMFEGQVLPNIFKIDMLLTPSTNRTMSAMDVKKYVFNKVKEKDITSIKKLFHIIDAGGPPSGKPIELHIVGNDNKKRLALIHKIKKEIKQFNVIDIDTNFRLGKKELRIKPNYKTIAQAQLNVTSIASVIRTAFDGTEAAHIDTPDERIPFRVMLDKKSVNFNKPLDGLFVLNNVGRRVPLEQLVTVESTRSPQTIYHYKGVRVNSIYGNIKENISSKTVYAKIKNAYKDFEKKYPGFKMVLRGEAERSSNIFLYMMFAIGLAVLAIYFVLVIQFNSFMQPAMVITAIPFGIVGILLAFGIQGMDLAMISLTGIMGYSGVVINDSLIMVDYINRIKVESGNKINTKTDIYTSAIIEGAVLRLRPIFLTTVTTVAGLIPTAYGFFGGSDIFVSPMVMAMA